MDDDDKPMKMEIKNRIKNEIKKLYKNHSFISIVIVVFFRYKLAKLLRHAVESRYSVKPATLGYGGVANIRSKRC